MQPKLRSLIDIDLNILFLRLQDIKYAKVIYLEVNEKELYNHCALITDIDEYLLKYNFKRILTKMTKHGWGDALYVLDN